MTRSAFNGCLLSTRAIIFTLILGVGFVVGIFILIYYSRPPRTKVVAVTAALTVIPSSSTVTPTSMEVLPTDQPNSTPTLQPGSIGIGVFVQVSGTGGDGLRLRKEPGLSSEMQFLGLDGELFQVGDGPVDQDGYTWWFVIGSYDETRQGWAAADFLEVVNDQ
jgi:hypothetical protein